MNTKNLFFLIILSFIFVSCSDDEEAAPGKYDNGVLVVNEGNFGDADGSVSFYDYGTSETNQKIFESENDRPFAGLLQSVTIHNDRAYLIDNIGNRVEIVNSSDFISIGIISDALNQPRYFTASNGKGYISNWGPYDENFSLNESFVLVFDLETFNILKTIPVAAGPEGIIEAAGRVYVNSSFTDVLSVIDPSSDEVIEEINIPFGCGQIVKDANENLWSACSSGFLISLNTSDNTVVSTTPIENLSNKLTIDNESGIIYSFTSEFAPDFSFTTNSLLRIQTTTPESASTIYESRNIYGVGVSNDGQEIYVANSNAFQGNGTIIILDNSGETVDDFPSGRGPNGFIFR